MLSCTEETKAKSLHCYITSQWPGACERTKPYYNLCVNSWLICDGTGHVVQHSFVTTVQNQQRGGMSAYITFTQLFGLDRLAEAN